MAIDLTHDMIAELRRDILAELAKLHEEIEEVRVLVLTPDEELDRPFEVLTGGKPLTDADDSSN